MSFDESAKQELDERAANISRKIAERAESATKKTWADFECKHCQRKQRHLVEIEDTKAMLEAAEFLANRGFGRPSQKQEDADDEKVVFVRKVIFSGSAEDD